MTTGRKHDGDPAARGGKPARGRSESQRRLQAALQELPAVLWTTDRELRFTGSMGAGLVNLGLQPGEVVGRTLAEYFGTDDPDYPPLASHRRALEGEVVTYEDEWEGRVYLSRVEPLRDGRRITGTIGIAIDISERKNAELAVRESEERLRALVETAPDAILNIDHRGLITFANTQASRLFGYPTDELLFTPASEVLPDVAWDPEGDAAGEHDDAPAVQFERQARHRDGSSFPVEVRLSVLRTSHGPLITAIVRDVTERKRFEAQLRYLAEHDPLTGLLNRRRFEHELEEALGNAKRYDRRGALLLLDIDNLKDVNDTLGHKVGDVLIRGVAELVDRRLRDTDIVGRLGGDEFAVILPQADQEEAAGVAGELLEAIRTHRFAGAVPSVRAQASIGVAPIDDASESAEELLAGADAAMYEAKEAGRNQVAVLSEAGERDTRAQRGWAERVRRALQPTLERERFVLHAQPIRDLATARSDDHELLLRMASDDGRIVAPAAFLGPAERMGLSSAIDRWVTDSAIALLATEGREAGRLAINVSGKSLGDRELLAGIEREIAVSEVDPGRLTFELTERSAVALLDEAAEFARALKSLGCRVALDDFGSGFGSFVYLRHLPLDEIKIDGDFVRNLPRSGADRTVVGAMVSVARDLGLGTVAEYVGDDETLDILGELGVDHAQGFHLGRPVPVEEVFEAGA